MDDFIICKTHVEGVEGDMCHDDIIMLLEELKTIFLIFLFTTICLWSQKLAREKRKNKKEKKKKEIYEKG